MEGQSIVWVTAGLILVGSIGVFLILLVKLREFYIQRQIVSLDPFNKFNYPDHFESGFDEKKNGVRVLFYGDSRALQWTEPFFDDSVQFINRGIGGQSTAQILGRFDSHVKDLKPNIIVLQLGINDLKTIPFLPEFETKLKEMCKNNITGLVQQCSANGIHVILSTIFPLGNVPYYKRVFRDSHKIHQTILEINEYLKKINGLQIELLDSFQILADQNGYAKKEYVDDLLHINQNGYRVINNHLITLLRKYIRVN